MSIICDTSEWIPGCILIGDTGFGVLGSEIASTGDAGAGYLFNDLSLPADANKEICGQITTWPSAGTLYAYEDSSFEFYGAPDGTYLFQYQLYVDGVATGPVTNVTLNVGSNPSAFTFNGNSASAFSGLYRGAARFSFSASSGSSFTGSAQAYPEMQFAVDSGSEFVGAFYGTGEAIWPSPSDVRVGIIYGPSGNDYTGAMASTGDTPEAIANAVLSSQVEGSITLQEAIRLQNAVLLGKVLGAGSGTEVFRDLSDSKDRIVATVDTVGNRITIYRDPT